MANVGIVIVSHSPKVAEGAADMVRQMVGDEREAGLDRRQSGRRARDRASRRYATRSNAPGRRRASQFSSISAARRPTAKWRSKCSPEDKRGRVVVCNAPIVEGAVIAATEASGGASSTRCGALRRSCRHDDRCAGHPGRARRAFAMDESPRPSALLTNAIGLHARPVGQADQARQDIRCADRSCHVGRRALGGRQEHRQGHGGQGRQGRESCIFAPTVPTRRRRSRRSSDLVGAELPRDEADQATASPERMAELRLSGSAASGGFAAGPSSPFLATGARPKRDGWRAGGGDCGAASGDRAARSTSSRSSPPRRDERRRGYARLSDRDAGGRRAVRAGLRGDRRRRSRRRAWRAALDDEIAGYEAADDENFRARASDLEDIRDRVLAILRRRRTSARSARGRRSCVGEDLTPSRFLAIDWSGGGGIALTRGSASGHVATLARARGVPMIVGLGSSTWRRDGRSAKR